MECESGYTIPNGMRERKGYETTCCLCAPLSNSSVLSTEKHLLTCESQEPVFLGHFSCLILVIANRFQSIIVPKSVDWEGSRL
jgi:hypothetical protein